MSRFEPEDDDTRVYVNNMNTKLPSVKLPVRTKSKYSVPHPNPRAGDSGGGDEDIDAMTRTHMSSSYGRYGMPAASMVQNVSTPQETLGEELHSNLDQVYKRIMRTLQRQLNYEEVARLPLAVQFGVVMEEETAGIAQQFSTRNRKPQKFRGEDPSRESESPNANKRSTALSLFANDEHFAKKAAGEGVSQSSGINDSGAAANDSGALGSTKQPPSGGLEVRYKAQDDAHLQGDDALAMQPCPRTLRLVTQHVQDTVYNKLSMAERGTLKDCVRFTFECRALLDRLIKEIPSYTPFPEGDLSNLPSRGSVHRTGFRVQDVLRELKKEPVAIPSGRFISEAATGEVIAELEPESLEGVGQQMTVNSTTALRTRANTPLVTNTPTGMGRLAGGSAGHHSTLISVCQQAAVDILGPRQLASETGGLKLPPGYRKSNRLMTVPPSTSESPLFDVLMEDIPFAGEAMRSGALRRLNSSLSARSNSLLGDSDSSRLRRPGRGVGGFGEEERRATQLHSVGTCTEENNTNTVSMAEYVRLQDYAKSLEVKVVEAEQSQASLQSRLSEERNYTASRAGIIQYLRETLLRECNALRSQVYFATLKEQQLQEALKVREVGPSLTNGGNSREARVRQPAISLRRNNTNVSSMTRRTTTSVVAPHASQHTNAQTTLHNASAFGPLDTSCSLSVSASTRNNTASGALATDASVVATTPSNVPAESTPGGSIGNDINSLQSLLDLVLLAVEKEEVFPASLQDLKHMTTESIQACMQKSEKCRADELRAAFEEKQRHLRSSLMSQKVKNGFEIAAKDKEIARLEKMTDLDYVRNSFAEGIHNLRMGLHSLKNSVNDELHAFQRMMTASLASVVNRATLIDQTLADHTSVQQTLNAMKVLIDSIYALFMPMLTSEYKHGYHPWPAKLRNSLDPLAHVIRIRYGPSEVLRLREQLSIISNIYIAIHKFVSKQIVIPDISRPSTGEVLEMLCSRMALSSLANMDVTFQVREAFSRERAFMRRLARLNFQILRMLYLHTAITERCVVALISAGIDPQRTNLPVRAKLNEYARHRGVLTRERNSLHAERIENMKGVYRLWQERRIDIWEGYPSPVILTRLTILSEAEVTMATPSSKSLHSVVSHRKNTHDTFHASESPPQRHASFLEGS